jgi:hypothetical protein
MSDLLSVTLSVEGVRLPVIGRFEYEEPDRASGVTGGWYLVEAELDLSNRQRCLHPTLAKMLWDREAFEAMFGRTALQVAEEGACDHYMGLREDAEEAKEEVLA